MNPHGWTTFRQVGCFSRQEEEGGEQHHNYHHHHHHHHHNDHHDHKRSMTSLGQDKLPFHQRATAVAEPSSDSSYDRHDNRQLLPAGPGPVRLLGHDRTPEGCAAHCATKMGGGIGFFGIGFGDE